MTVHCNYVHCQKSISLLLVQAWLTIFEPVVCHLIFRVCSFSLCVKISSSFSNITPRAVQTVDLVNNVDLFFSKRCFVRKWKFLFECP